MSTPLRSAASAVWLAIGLGWLLHVGQSVLVPVVFGILIAYVTDALARLLMRVPVVGGHLRGGSAHLAAALAIALVLAILAQQELPVLLAQETQVRLGLPVLLAQETRALQA